MPSGAGMPDDSLLIKIGTPRARPGSGRPGSSGQHGGSPRAMRASGGKQEEEPNEAEEGLRAQLAVWHLRARLQRELALQARRCPCTYLRPCLPMRGHRWTLLSKDKCLHVSRPR